MSEFPCLISGERTCKPTPPKDLVFIIGSGSSEFEEELKVAKEVLKGFGFKGYFALLSEEEKGLDAFCDKICSKILNSLFCLIMLNDPVALEYIDEASKEKKILRAPRANVYYEFGIAISLRKRIIPIMREGTKLPFDIQHLDAMPYNGLEELKNKLTEAVKATLLKPSMEKIAKVPMLGLLLVDEHGKASETIEVQPIITKIAYVDRKVPLTQLEMASQLSQTLASALSFGQKEPDKELVPIGLEMFNDGDMPAENILVYLEFPEDCELVKKRDAVGGFDLSTLYSAPTQGGLYIDKENERTAKGWLDRLGNDRMTRGFDEIYVRFPTEEEKEYRVKATVIQDFFPRSYYDFKIVVKPKFVEEKKYKK